MSQTSAKQWLHSPLAIVGMACRLPGADDLAEFWDLLVRGGYAVERMPDRKLDRPLYFDPEKGKRGKTYSQIGGFVRERELDWSLLNIKREEASQWDQCHLNLCEVAARACVNAGYDPRNLELRNTSVFVGHSGGTTLGGDLAFRTLLPEYLRLLEQIPEWHALGSTGVREQLQAQLTDDRPGRHQGRPYVDAGFASGLISKNFGLTGSHMSIDAACASSLVALALGAMSLASGQSDMAIIGGASYNKSDSLVLFSHAQSCSAQMSRPFDQDADGLISSEGYVSILIKRLDTALAAGDRIHAVIRGIGYSSDGRGRSLWAPRHEGQSTAIQRAYPESIDPASVQMIEAHATSTQVGDATEMEALASFYGPKLASDQRLPVGSVKSNIGHTLETAGLAGLVKAVLSIQNSTIPPSINVTHHNETIPWSTIPFFVPQTALPWPQLSARQPRRAAVNAFGIGGLNVHVVVDQFIDSSEQSRVRQSAPSISVSIKDAVAASCEPIALVGRGLVLPGAKNVAEFQRLLAAEFAASTSQSKRVAFEYDWRKHKVPPKQVAHANPLQFMLLEAAEQAIHEACLLNEEFDRSSTAVVVGSIFGGDFGNELFAGLRLPEIRDRLQRSLLASGISAEQADHVVERFERLFLQHYPALLDETGSFTSSTLASRISKTFNLMGGAMAIDAGDVSGLAALKTACWLLQSNTASTVLCAAGQRALDSAALENLDQIGRLRTASNPEGYAVGEGVALVVLKRLSDARRDKNKVLAVIDSVGLGYDSTNLAESLRFSLKNCGATVTDATIIGRLGIDRFDKQVASAVPSNQIELPVNLEHTGHLQGAQGLVDLITCTFDKDNSRKVIIGQTLSGQSAVVSLTLNNNLSNINSSVGLSDSRNIPRLDTTVSQLSNLLAPNATSVAQVAKDFDWKKVGIEVGYWSADTLDQLKFVPQAKDWKPCESIPRGRFVAAVVAPVGDAASKARKLSALIGTASHLDNLIDQGMWWADRNSLAAQPPRVALAFSGQGSQYVGMLRGLAERFEDASALMKLADTAFAKIDGSSFAQMAWSSDNQLGENVWQTQAALLVADSMLAQVVRSFGLEPDVVFGHSYGEIPAMLAAGALDLSTAITLTWHRCQSVGKYAPTGSSMLSVQADANWVAEVIAEYHLPLTISHINAPLQTVVGGKQAHVAQLAALFEDLGIASRILPVPTAFHTPALQPAVEPFRQSLSNLRIQPPRIPLLSSVNNRFMADPELIRDGLAEQLVTPLQFVALMQKLASQGITHVIEIGPQKILTRLARASGTGLQVLPSDYGPQGENSPLAFMPLALLSAFCQATGLSGKSENSGIPSLAGRSKASTSSAVFNAGNASTTALPVKHFDATATRRQRLRGLSSQPRMFPQTISHQPVVTESVAATVKTAESQSPVLSQPIQHPGPSVGQPTAANDVPTTGEVEQILIDFVVEQTGYPAEIVELDADLEADLGIDSIKKAQLLGELRELFPQAISALQTSKGTSSNDARAQGNRLAELRTLRDFVKLFSTKAEPTTPQSLSATKSPATSSTSLAASSPSTNAADAQNTLVTQPAIKNAPANQIGTSRKSLEQFVVDFVVEQTGYPAEIVELNADLEADLGIDSIKKAQLLGELRETFSLKLPSASDSIAGQQAKPKSTLDQLRTLNQILDLLAQQLGVAEPEEINSEPLVNQPIVANEKVAEHSASDTLCNDRAAAIENTAVSLRSAEPKMADDSAKDPGSVLALCSACSGGLPILSGVDHPNGFADAIRLNLRALPARPSLRSEDEDFKSPVSPAVQELAEHANVCPESIQAFDHHLVQDSGWSLIRPSSQTLGEYGQPDSTCYVLSLQLPDWLTAGQFQPVGIRTNLNAGCLEVLTPGVTTPLVLINERNQLIAAGSQSMTTRVWLSERLPQLAASENQSLLATVRGWNAPGDWWLVAVDPDQSRLEEIHSCNQVFTHSQHNLNRWLSDDNLPEEAASQLGYDAQLSSWVVLSRSGALYQPVRNLVPLQALLTSSRSQSNTAWGEPSAFESSQVDSVIENNFFAEFCSDDLTDSSRSEASAKESSYCDATVEALDQPQTSTKVAMRYVLRMAPAPQIEAPGRQPTWSGSAVVVGNNAIANQLEARLRASGVDVVRLSADGKSNVMALSQKFVAIAETKRLPHLFITSACDVEAKFSLDEAAWKSRRNVGLMSIFWLCQKWVEHVTGQEMTDDASLISVSSLGGDFGIGGKVYSAEGGGINGLLKSILIESWMQGVRSLPIKTIDTSPQQSPAEIVNCIWRELAVPSYDNEISYRDGVRHILKAVPRAVTKPNPANRLRKLTRGGNWVCTGGARGITALVAERLAMRYGLTLHLLGTSPAPDFDPAWRHLDAEGMRQLKLQVMTDARKIGVNPVKHWQNTEKQLEIDATLERLRALGVQAFYYSCDVVDRGQLAGVLAKVRQHSGPINGVLHGAGVGRDSRFDRKQPEKVEQCIGAKVDGALALMQATWDDPLEAFLGFGSISGRFGANGHTDYSLANEMLCKEIDWLKSQRPDVRAIGFHWHAWGDVGMATKPETKLALEMIHMQFMPAEEGIEHLVNELEGDANESEVLITDDRYYRAFYPAETLVAARGQSDNQIVTPLLSEVTSRENRNGREERRWQALVNPTKDPFLAEHLLDGKPLLPFVVASEMLMEAAAASLGSSRLVLHDIQAHGAIRFFAEAEQELSLISHISSSAKQADVELRSDFVSRKGVVVDRQRLNFTAKAQILEAINGSSHLVGSTLLPLPDKIDWQHVHYPTVDAEFYVGWPLQKLRKVALLDGGLVGKISAPALIELAGVTRSTLGWTIPSAALDACLFAVGILAWQRIAPGSALPVRFGKLQLGRHPNPGEACTVHAVLNSYTADSASFDFSLYGVDEALILDVVDYEVAWLSRSKSVSDLSVQPEQR